MRINILAAAICAMCAAPALAQSSITIYGIADVGVQVSNFGKGAQYNLSSGIADGSRLGFKGTEDLGGGYKAMFVMESRIEIDTGGQSNGMIGTGIGQGLTRGLPPTVAAQLTPVLQPVKVVNPTGAGFDRSSYVGLVTPAGAILMGRQYTPDYEVVAMTDTFETGFAGGWGNILGGTGGFITAGTAIRANQAVQYRMQLPSGFGASAMYAFQETGSLNLSRKFWGGNLRYQANGWNVGLAYNREHDQSGNLSLQSLTLGGSYVIGNAKVFAGYHRMKNDHSALVPLLTPVLGATAAGIVGENAKLDGETLTVGMHYRIGSGRIMAAISRTNDKRPTNNDVTLYGLGYDYDLSKRTDLYIALARAVNQHASQYALGGAGYFGGFTEQPGQNANVLQIGMRHRF